MNSTRKARYSYKPFLNSTFASIYQFMIQKAFKFIVKDLLVKIHRHKNFVLAKTATNSLPRHYPFLCDFVKARA